MGLAVRFTYIMAEKEPTQDKSDSKLTDSKQPVEGQPSDTQRYKGLIYIAEKKHSRKSYVIM